MYNWLDRIPTDQIIEWREYLHQHPELSFKEFKTSQYIYDTLSTFPNLQLTRPTPTSVVATLVGTAGEGKTIALRADMDALPIKEESNVDFKSLNDGVMHACGHDTHVAMLLGAASVLSGMKDEIAGTVKFIFQHAEEQVPGGAHELVDVGVLKDVDQIFGIHILPRLKAGSLGVVTTGYTTTAADGFFLKIQGKGSHASTPELSIDPIIVGSHLVMALQTIVSRNVPAHEMAILSVGEFHSGQAPNIIADTANLSCSIRTTNEEIRTLMEKRVREVVDNIAAVYGATVELDYVRGYSAVYSTPSLAQSALESAKKVLGEDLVYESPMLMASEDFSAYTNVVPGCFMFLGGGLEEEGCGYMNHHPKFKVLNEALVNGTKVEVQLILDLLGSK